MKQAVRAIIIEDDNLLVMKRDKFGHHYYTLIGGHVDMGESLEKALYREVHEETMVRIANPRKVYIEHVEPPYGEQHVYLCDYISGIPMLHPDADERQINKDGQNVYTPMWIPLSQLEDLPLLPAKLKQRIIKHAKQGFPEEPQEFNDSIQT